MFLPSKNDNKIAWKLGWVWQPCMKVICETLSAMPHGYFKLGLHVFFIQSCSCVTKMWVILGCSWSIFGPPKCLVILWLHPNMYMNQSIFLFIWSIDVEIRIACLRPLIFDRPSWSNFRRLCGYVMSGIKKHWEVDIDNFEGRPFFKLPVAQEKLAVYLTDKIFWLARIFPVNNGSQCVLHLNLKFLSYWSISANPLCLFNKCLMETNGATTRI